MSPEFDGEKWRGRLQSMIDEMCAEWGAEHAKSEGYASPRDWVLCVGYTFVEDSGDQWHAVASLVSDAPIYSSVGLLEQVALDLQDDPGIVGT